MFLTHCEVCNSKKKTSYAEALGLLSKIDKFKIIDQLLTK